jgi:hypothetical protein
MSIEEIVANIDARIAALQADIQPLLDAKVALRNSAAVSKTTKRRQVEAKTSPAATPGAKTEPAKPAKPAKPARRARRPKVDPVPSGKLIALLEGSDGMTSTALAEQTGGDPNQIRVLLKELADAGQVRKTGERRGTRWHLITDEEQIAARAAEIEAQFNTARVRDSEPAQDTSESEASESN